MVFYSHREHLIKKEKGINTMTTYYSLSYIDCEGARVYDCTCYKTMEEAEAAFEKMNVPNWRGRKPFGKKIEKVER